MQFKFKKPELERLYSDAGYTGGYSSSIVKSFRKVMQMIDAAADERDLYAIRGLRYEKLSGKRSAEHSLRLNDQWRLIIKLEGNQANKKVLIIDIEDYH